MPTVSEVNTVFLTTACAGAVDVDRERGAAFSTGQVITTAARSRRFRGRAFVSCRTDSGVEKGLLAGGRGIREWIRALRI